MQTFSGSLKTLASVCLITTVLSACTAVALGGAALGGNAVIERRSTGAIADDGVMEVRIRHRAIEELKKRYIQRGISDVQPELSIISYDRRILLLGQVVNESDRGYVEALARHESNAKSVFNYIQVNQFKRTPAHVINDTWMTSRLRARLINIKGVYPGHVKIVTFNNVVYVMGILTPEQQTAVTELIRTTPGVYQVVTLYQNYLPTPIQTSY